MLANIAGIKSSKADEETFLGKSSTLIQLSEVVLICTLLTHSELLLHFLPKTASTSFTIHQ